jgi:hypothetical protein
MKLTRRESTAGALGTNALVGQRVTPAGSDARLVAIGMAHASTDPASPLWRSTRPVSVPPEQSYVAEGGVSGELTARVDSSQSGRQKPRPSDDESERPAPEAPLLSRERDRPVEPAPAIAFVALRSRRLGGSRERSPSIAIVRRAWTPSVAFRIAQHSRAHGRGSPRTALSPALFAARGPWLASLEGNAPAPAVRRRRHP